MIRPYLPGDIWIILPQIRQAELDECHALGETPEASLREAIYSGDTVTLELNGEICGIAGVVHYEDYSTPWSVFTNAIERNPIQFLKECRRWLERYDMPLLNVVDERFAAAQKWLHWLGFTVGEPIVFGPHQMAFRPYWKNFKGVLPWAGQQA